MTKACLADCWVRREVWATWPMGSKEHDGFESRSQERRVAWMPISDISFGTKKASSEVQSSIPHPDSSPLPAWVQEKGLCEPLKKNPGQGKCRFANSNYKPCCLPLRMQEVIQGRSWCCDWCILDVQRSSGMETG